MGSNLLTGMGFPFGVTKYFETRQRWWLQNTVNVLNATEFFTLKCLILCYLNFTSNYLRKQLVWQCSNKILFTIYLFFKIN